MTEYRLLERLDSKQQWLPDGVAYAEGQLCLLYRLGQIIRLRATSLNELGEEDFPYEKEKRFRWAPIRQWQQTTPFEPQQLLQSPSSERGTGRSPLYTNPDQIPPDIRQYLQNYNLTWQSQQENFFKQLFVDLYNSGSPPFRILVEGLWRRWISTHQHDLPFSNPEHNVALLLYARVFGLPVHTNPEQVEYLTKYSSLFAPVVATSAGYGPRAALSENVLATLNAPVMHAWLFREGNVPQRIIIAGKGLAEFRNQIFSNALITAMRVQASDSDILNDGLISIERRISPGQDAESALDIRLPVIGAEVPLADAETSESAMREFMRQLERLEQDVGFVETHETDIDEIKSVQRTFGRLAKETVESGETIVWAPSRSTRDLNQETLTIQPLLLLTGERRRGGPRGTTPPLSLALSPELLGTELWKRLFDAYYEEVIHGIELDARIRLEFYDGKVKSLRSEKEQWDMADAQQRSERWGLTVTLNQRFDHETGLSIWLHPPDTISTEKYYVEITPHLINSYEEWARKMKGILESLRAAAERPDRPFYRLITTRLFDRALRRSEPEELPRIQRLYREWAGPTADLLCFEWRKKIRRLRGNPDDLFTAHTTFNLRLMGEGTGHSMNIKRIEMLPYTLVDTKRSVALFDRNRGFMIVNDPSDFPEQVGPQAGQLVEDLFSQSDEVNIDEVTEQVRARLIDDPRQVCRQIIRLLKPPISDSVLVEDAADIRNADRQGREHTTFLHEVDLADSAMDGRALLTTYESLDAARRAMPDFLQRWENTRKVLSQTPGDAATTIPDAKELECRLYLLAAIAECIAADFIPKEYLPDVYRSPHTTGKHEIRSALAAARNVDQKYTSNWIERLSTWDLAIAYRELMRGLPSREELTVLEEHAAMQVFDVVELISVTKSFREATASLSHLQERRASALVKLAPALEAGFLSVPAKIISGDLRRMLELLTGRQVATGSGSQL